MQILPIVVAVLVSVCGPGAHAATLNAKAGLWETTSTSKIEGAASTRAPDLSKLAPDQRARAAQAMASRGDGRPAVSVTQQCVSPDMLQKWETFAKGEATRECQRKLIDQSDRHVKMTVSCASGKSVGEMEISVLANDRITGKMGMLMRTDTGERKVDVSFESRWLGADCGKLKPGEGRPISASTR
jgi:hypothetical protein